MAKKNIPDPQPTGQDVDDTQLLMYHYSIGTQDMDVRRTRLNGWNEIVNEYMGKLPPNWPYTSVVTDPRIRTTVLEKTARLLNSKLQGRLVPREGGDIVKARINNAVLDFQWDYANEGGSMVEKVAMSDQTCRLFGAAFAFVYWDTVKNCNEMKPLDSRDVFIDPAANHIRNAKWVQIREFTTADQLKKRGFDVTKLLAEKSDNMDAHDRRDTAYDDQVKLNKSLEDRTGTDPAYQIYEVVTEWTPTERKLFLPRHGVLLKKGPNPFKHGFIPVAQLRYYPLGSDVYGESEVEPVISLARAINALLCGFVDEMNLAMRPPLKITSSGVRMETIEYGPGAKWIVDAINNVEELTMGQGSIQNFNNSYPALVAAFNTAMGDSSLGISNIQGYNKPKTATEVGNLEKQQNNRDQYNQLYLGEFLKDIMMMWLANNKQYLFDDPKMKYKIIKIIGKDNIKDLESLGLGETEIPDNVMNQIAGTISQYPKAVADQELQKLMQEVSIPKNPVVLNPNESPENYEVKPKLDVKKNGEADLYLTSDDLDGVYDYVPDVKSMAIGAGAMTQKARQEAIQMALNPAVQQMLQMRGETLDIKELIVASLEDAGYKDAESLFSNDQSQGQPSGVGPQGLGAPQPSQRAGGVVPVHGVPGGPQAIPFGPVSAGVPQPTGF